MEIIQHTEPKLLLNEDLFYSRDAVHSHRPETDKRFPMSEPVKAVSSGSAGSDVSPGTRPGSQNQEDLTLSVKKYI